MKRRPEAIRIEYLHVVAFSLDWRGEDDAPGSTTV